MADIRRMTWHVRGGNQEPTNPYEIECSLEDGLQGIKDTMQLEKDYDHYAGVYIEFNASTERG